MSQRHRPRRIHPSAKRRVDHDAHRASLIAKMLDDDGAIVRYDASRETLHVDVLAQRVDRRLVACVARGELIVAHAGYQLAAQLTDSRAERHGSRRVFAVPERHPRRRTRCWRHYHAIVTYLRDAPRGGSQLEDVADARLVHEFLVQLAESRAVREIHGVETAVRDRAAGYHGRHPARARTSEPVGRTIERDARLQLRRDF